MQWLCLNLCHDLLCMRRPSISVFQLFMFCSFAMAYLTTRHVQSALLEKCCTNSLLEFQLEIPFSCYCLPTHSSDSTALSLARSHSRPLSRGTPQLCGPR